MQNIGFVFSIYPALKKLYRDRNSLKIAVNRHLELVNTNPSMGPLLMGLTMRLEKDRDKGEDVIKYRRAMMSSLAAQGDHIFWGVVKPLAAVVGVLAALALGTTWAGALLALLLYNVPSITVRAFGFGLGWSVGLPILAKFQSSILQRTLSWARDLTACGLGVIVGVIIWDMVSKESCNVSLLTQIMAVWITLAAGVAGFFLLYRDVPLGLVIFLASFGSLFLLASI